MFIVSCPVEFFSPSGATSDVPRCRSLRSLGGLFLRNYKHFAPLGLRPQNPLVPANFKSEISNFRRPPSRSHVLVRHSTDHCQLSFCLPEWAGRSFFAGGTAGKLNVRKPVIGFLSCANSSPGNSHCRAAAMASRFIS